MGILKGAVTRLLKLLAVVLVVSFLTFSLTKLLPGDPVVVLLGPQYSNVEVREAVQEDLGLNKPFLTQYVQYLGNVAQGDLGRSYTSKFETTELLKQKLPATIELMLLAQLVSLTLAIPLALFSAFRSNSRTDKAITTASFGLISIPGYAFAVFLVWLFALRFNWFPAIGYQPISEGIVGNLRSIALPLAVLVAGLTAVYTRLLRSDLISTLQEDFILMARSKGLPTRYILARHALRPSSFSLITVFGIQFGTLIGGAVIIEQFFVLPGIGSLAIESILKRDYLVVQGVVLLIAISFVLINFLIDILYTILDPRVRRAGA
ncbi:MAG: ABC transporter permease [Acidimicrobiia bacterium]|nr:ABC transporter permease [Acidimicrobiia bacterium]